MSQESGFIQSSVFAVFSLPLAPSSTFSHLILIISTSPPPISRASITSRGSTTYHNPMLTFAQPNAFEGPPNSTSKMQAAAANP
ncbi:hypothetical protein GALMADRAFT_256389 [Galerina marginata CBS 339.88]|uniref:Uncharacterized protein n=1 Tax=Galerina marginata (strain CBS 339.88) TaxID=685588 RepID=A0A067SMG8_GALM3|nr:hypothetical protein GALMADRAFT_256389 [Galerina marginata CBS 339.88]